MEYIHKQNVLHLDVKPSNILIRNNGEAVLIDFGISKRYDDAGGQTSTTPTGISKGYAPIEQYNQGLQNFSPATDVYSLGATLFKLLTGQTPPEAPMLLDDEEFPDCPSNVSTSIWSAIEKAMEPRKKKRYQSVNEFVSALTTNSIANNPKVEIPKQEETVVIPSAPSYSVKPFVSEETLFMKSEYNGRKEYVPESKTKIERDAQAREERRLQQERVIVENGKKEIEIKRRSISSLSDGWFDVKIKHVLFKMRYVEQGQFYMGADSNIEDVWADELPMHLVNLSKDFCIGETLVTQELWLAVMGYNPSSEKTLKMPVNQVSWNECQTFINKLNDLTNGHFRLPTEAEWEFACKGGKLSQNFVYSGSNICDDVAWYDDGDNKWQMHPVKQKKPNELGLYDMSGNLWEWCQDCYAPYKADYQVDPLVLNGNAKRVRRGGSWYNSANACRCTVRNGYNYNQKGTNIGFRIVLDII